MPPCPTCGQTFGTDVRFCPDDGTPLTETAAGTAAQSQTVSVSPAAPLGTLIGGRYRIAELRGGGGMAHVFRAIDATLEREVAVKLINPSLRTEPEFDARFQREARIASQLTDPHIVVVHDYGLDPAHGPFLVMEYLRGQSLRERLRSDGPLPFPAGMQLGAQLLLALVHAHERGVVHRDIKPDNVFLLNQSGVRLLVRVLDFGIARIYRADAPVVSSTITQPGAVVGTPRYMAPEQLAGELADARTDLYSAAVVLHEALTGELPYLGGRPLSAACPEAPPELQALLERCLQPDRNRRPSSAAEVYLKLHDLGKASGALLVSSETLQSLADPPAALLSSSANTITYQGQPQRRFWNRRRSVLVALGAAIGLLVLGILIRPGTAPAPEIESLAGIRLGDERDAVVAAFGKPSHPGGSPWSARPALFGELLRPTDVGSPADGDALTLLTWNDDHVGVLLAEDRVRAMVVRVPCSCETGRGLRLGDTERRLRQRYEEPTETDPVHYETTTGANRKRAAWGMIYRYANVGISAEVRDERVTGLALYPPTPQP